MGVSFIRFIIGKKTDDEKLAQLSLISGPADRNRTCIARLGGMCSIR